ncbi:hypothetical protein [Psychroflexus sediminis]|uniref:Uncharacterized protein n=1 Tax=Psychroflexus sediminis TaxID=470826 RepID=A0A1G7Z4I2_9FLAO|nr:hypothetical protein [Psychroflexus sediminis]SDH03661.1 hypothetical protein SAMN04488027_11818 [Psychroflexus sediminis]
MNYENYIRQEYSDHKIIEITYEQLTKNPNETIDKIRKEFDIDSFKIETPLAKQNTESIEDLVINFEELEKKLTGTQFHPNLSES